MSKEKNLPRDPHLEIFKIDFPYLNSSVYTVSQIPWKCIISVFDMEIEFNNIGIVPGINSKSHVVNKLQLLFRMGGALSNGSQIMIGADYSTWLRSMNMFNNKS